MDEFVHELGELRHLVGEVVEDGCPVPFRHRRLTSQQVDVRAHRRERGAELVGGVANEPVLLSAGLFERGEHGVEARGEAADLVGAFHLDTSGELLGLGNVLGRLGELGHRTERRPRNDQPQPCGSEDPEDACQPLRSRQVTERCVGLVERPRQLEEVVADRCRDHAQPLALHLDRLEPMTSARIDDRQHQLLAARDVDDAVFVDGLEVEGVEAGAATERVVRAASAALSLECGEERESCDLVGTLDQRCVDLLDELATRRRICGEGRKADRHRDCGGGDQGDAPPQRHDGRATKPTPRTVWMTRGSPPASVLRRRYPT